jgi:hypothetical protein
MLMVFSMVYSPLPSAYAASLPSGGSTIDAAVAISAGAYSVGTLETDENHFFSIGIKPGQELVVSGKFIVKAENEQYGTLNTLELYDDSKESLVSAFDDASNLISIAALASSAINSQTFYIRISDDTWGTESGELTIALNDRYDASSGTDAGQSITSAISIEPGSYKGYLSENDTDDYYAVLAKSGAFSVNLTPDVKARPTIKIYDSNRTELKNEMADNVGQIMAVSTDLTSDQTVYVDVNCDINAGCESAASEYTMVIGAVAGTDTGEEKDISEEKYPNVVPPVPTGGGVAIDQEVTPILKKVYDDKVKIASQTGKNTLIYVFDRTVAVTDLAAIKAAMEGIGYQSKEYSPTKLVMIKGFKKLTFTTTVGSDRIEVKSAWIMNWLWGGIIGGAIVLIVLILVIILVTKNRKPVLKQTAPPDVSVKDS